MTHGLRTVGLAGRMASAFLHSRLTPLTVVASVLLGLLALATLPREEEPQIQVPMVDVALAWPGMPAEQVESQLTSPMERALWQIPRLEYLYSISRQDGAMLIARFEVGSSPEEALTRVRTRLDESAAMLPAGARVWTVSPRSIDDVPVLALTLAADRDDFDQGDLRRVAAELAAELRKAPGVARVRLLGGEPRSVRVSPDPARMAAAGVTLDRLARSLEGAGLSLPAGDLVGAGVRRELRAESPFEHAADLRALLIPSGSGRPVRLSEIAAVEDGPGEPTSYVFLGRRGEPMRPAVTVEVSKRPGVNATELVHFLHQRVDELRPVLLAGVALTTTRDYGETAKHKSDDLMFHLLLATLSVIVLIALALGRREALVVAIAIPVTLALTLFLYRFLGYTLNRVTLFALIFSIGILVDDAIVVVENIHRHMQHGGRTLGEAIPAAVDEVGGPTILATFTVIAALLPMAFVTGLMGPYMRPIPINASTGMLISLAVAFVFTPWLYRRMFLQGAAAHATAGPGDRAMQRFFTRVMTPFLGGDGGRRNRWRLLQLLLGLIALSLALVALGAVVMKMLPFDNKSEFQVMVDMPEGTPVEETHRVLQALADALEQVPEVTDYQIYAGASAPINFNGLVRQYYLRRAPHQGDLQVNLLDKDLRDRKSHEIAASVREPLQQIGRRLGANVKIVEVPPGPPVLSPLVAEVYGLDYARQQGVARRVRDVFEQTPDVVDVDDTIEAPQEKLVVAVDRARAARLGVSQQSVASAVAAALGGEDMSYLHDEHAKRPVPVRVELSAGDKASMDALRSLRLRAEGGALVPLSEIAQLRASTRDQTIYHKDLLPVVYVTGDVAGRTDSPLYGMRAIASRLRDAPVDGEPIRQYLTRQPDDPYEWSLKWDGEWQVTFETFRDMGAAYAVGLVLIYLLVVAQFRSYGVPLIIMAPIPLTIIGILPGHALLGQQFTAPSMIGMIALAGIIVRNSILLVDFIQQEVAAGKPLQEATISAAAVRARPIALTAIAAMLGGFFILDDPIFGGLAVSLIFGLFVSTVLTLLVIPVVYYHYHWKRCASRG
ncbi:MAG TPA: efflux RND transporter permease subunit [Steroidobacteraceae bacterium]|nr:efflux RND transporter permease subunit [Steroidobacteraceae bacterium]